MLTDLICSGFASLVHIRCLLFGIMLDIPLAPYSKAEVRRLTESMRTGNRGMAETMSLSFDGTFRVRQHCFLMDTSIGWLSNL